MFCKFFVAATEKNLTWRFNFQLPQCKRGIIVADNEKWYTIREDFFLLNSVCYCDNVMTILKIWLVKYRNPDVRLISQIDIVMCFFYNISAISWRYRGRCHSDIITILECPLGQQELSYKWWTGGRGGGGAGSNRDFFLTISTSVV